MDQSIRNAEQTAIYHGVHYYRRELAEAVLEGWPEALVRHVPLDGRDRWVVVMPTAEENVWGVTVTKQGGMGFFDVCDPLKGARVSRPQG